MIFPQESDEFCPNCGEFVSELDGQTGFCYTCSPPSAYKLKITFEEWSHRYADDIEDVMYLYSLSAHEAISIVLSKQKAICIVCQEVILHGTYGRHFICNKYAACKRARRRYKYLVYDKNIPKDDALEMVLNQILGAGIRT